MAEQYGPPAPNPWQQAWQAFNPGATFGQDQGVAYNPPAPASAADQIGAIQQYAAPFLKWNQIGQQAIADEPINRGRAAEAAYAAQTPGYTPETGNMGNFGFRDIPQNMANALAFPVRKVSEAIGNVPAPSLRGALLGGTVFGGGERPTDLKPIKEQDPVTQFVYQSLPYILAPEAGMAAFVASLPATVQGDVQAYRDGQMTGKQLAGTLAMTLGPLIAPSLAKLGVKGIASAAALAKSPKGQALIADARTRLASGESGMAKIPGEGQPPIEPGAEGAASPGQIDMFAGEPVPPATQPQIEVPPQRPGGEVPLEERQALWLQSPVAPGGMFAETAASPGHLAPEVSAQQFGAAERFARVPTDQIRTDPALQARATDVGQTFSRARVNDIVKNYNPDLMTPLIVAPDPRNPGGYLVGAGFHRLAALKEMGLPADVQIVNLDLRDPAQFDKFRSIADASNATQHPLSLKERITVIDRSGTQDVGQLRSQFPAFNDQQIRDAQYISQLPGHVIEKLDKLPESSPLTGIAAEVGYGQKAYGLTPQEGESLFNRLTAGTKAKLPTRAAVRETIDKFGAIVQQRAQMGMFASDTGFGASNRVLDAMAEHARLTKEVDVAKRTLTRDLAGAKRLGMTADSPQIVRAQANLDALDARKAQLETDYLGAMRGAGNESAIARASSTEDARGMPPTASTEGVVTGSQPPSEMPSTVAAPPSGRTTLNNEPQGALEGGTSTENIASSIHPSPGSPEALRARSATLREQGDFGEAERLDALARALDPAPPRPAPPAPAGAGRLAALEPQIADANTERSIREALAPLAGKGVSQRDLAAAGERVRAAMREQGGVSGFDVPVSATVPADLTGRALTESGNSLPERAVARRLSQRAETGIVQGVSEKAAAPKSAAGVDVTGEQLARDTALYERAFGTKEPPPMPDAISVEGANRYLPERQQYIDQIKSTQEQVTAAEQRVKDVRDAYQSQASRRTAVRQARGKGMSETPQGMLSKNEIKAAGKDVIAARKARNDARAFMREADVRVSAEDVAARSRAAGADEATVKIFEEQARVATRMSQLDEPFLNLPSWRQRIDNVVARVQGGVSGKVNGYAQLALSMKNALREKTNTMLSDVIAPMQDALDREGANLTFIGNPKYAGLAESDFQHYVFTYPQDFTGYSPEFRALLLMADKEAGATYSFLHVLDPATQPPIAGRHLSQLWDYARAETEYVRRPGGRPGVTKARTIQDWRAVKASGNWPHEFKDMTPGELIEYSARATDEAIANAAFRRAVLREYGAKGSTKPGSGRAQFRNPLFAGWNAPEHIVSQIDAIFEPAPSFIKPLGAIVQPIKNMAFGPDGSVAGYNFLQAMAGGKQRILAALVNDQLNRIGWGMKLGDEVLPKKVLYKMHGLATGGAESPFAPGAGTMLKWIPFVGKRIDPILSKGMEKWQNIQYGTLMSSVNEKIADGNVIMAKLAGRDVTDPMVLRDLMDNANAISGTSRGASRVGRAQIESNTFSSARITRSQSALLGQIVNIVRTGATAEQRMMGAATLAEFMVTIGVVGQVMSNTFGDGSYALTPFKMQNGKPVYNGEWATVPIKGRRYSIIPQKSLAVAIAKTVAAMGSGDFGAAGKAWAQYGVSRVAPGVSDVPIALGFGFDSQKGFQAGTLSQDQRWRQMIPVPVSMKDMVTGGDNTSLRAIGENLVGLSSYSTTLSDYQIKAAAKAAAKAAGLPNADNVFKMPAVQETFAPLGLDPSGHQSFADYKKAYIAKYAPMAVTASHGRLSLPEAETATGKHFDAQQSVQNFTNGMSNAELNFWRQNPKLLDDVVRSGAFTPTNAERTIIDAYRRMRQPVGVP